MSDETKAGHRDGTIERADVVYARGFAAGRAEAEAERDEACVGPPPIDMDLARALVKRATEAMRHADPDHVTPYDVDRIIASVLASRKAVR